MDTLEGGLALFSLFAAIAELATFLVSLRYERKRDYRNADRLDTVSYLFGRCLYATWAVLIVVNILQGDWLYAAWLTLVILFLIFGGRINRKRRKKLKRSLYKIVKTAQGRLRVVPQAVPA